MKTADGKILKIADLVDDDPAKREKVSAALRDPTQKNNRDHVDIIIALGMAKEGFDWIWCEHALTVGYRSSLTEIVQIIGRATRDAPGKTRARFTNLIAEPDATRGGRHRGGERHAQGHRREPADGAGAGAALRVQTEEPEQRSRRPAWTTATAATIRASATSASIQQTGLIQLEIKGLAEPKSQEAERICREDLNELVTAFVQDKQTIERGMFDKELVPEELTQVRMGKIVKEKFPNLDEEDQEAVRQHAVAALNFVQQAKKALIGGGGEDSKNTALIDGVRKFALSVRELDIDLIDRINPFGEAYAILAKSMSEERLKQVAEVIAARRVSMTLDEARELAKRAKRFKEEKGRLPSLTAADPWEKRMAEGIAFLQRKVKESGNA